MLLCIVIQVDPGAVEEKTVEIIVRMTVTLL